ncbi:glucose-6-phosphate isomerase [Pelagibacterales bacterium SAG-MED14]|nr:glucose-6-phosphate isomerase [Pelagibacterales bacterium SAG-MED14]
MYFKNFKKNKKTNSSQVKKKLLLLFKEKNYILDSLKKNYKDSFSKKLINKYKKYSTFKVIGMGGSTLGTQTIYEFFKDIVKKDFVFIDNLTQKKLNTKKKRSVNLVVSKSGNTIETVVNSNIYIRRKDANIFVTENKDNYLLKLANKLKAEIVHHNNYIGGRYSVLSEVGMLPAELMGLDANKFRQLNSLIKNKQFINSLVSGISSTLNYIKNKKYNSIILNYDEKSENLFKWYQQLVAESLGKKSKGLLPIVSNMPKDNHSVMQLYLDGFKNNFYTFFYTNELKSESLKSSQILSSQKFLRGKNLSNIMYAQKIATENIFNKKKIPFRSFEIKKRSEKTLGELFCFFILETILIGKLLNVNPYDQPAVELIKKETKKLLI